MTKTPEGYSKILVMIDHATKFVIAKPTKDASAKSAADIMFEELICKYGAPKELWSDRGKAFTGEVAECLSQLFEIKRKLTSGYHPQTNGLTERFNRTIIEELAKSLNENKDDWVEWLPAKVFAYNTSIQKATGFSPFELLHTFSPRTPLEAELTTPTEKIKMKEWAIKMKEKAEAMRQAALKNQQRAAERQQEQHDKGLKPQNFQVGDFVRVYDYTAESSKPVKFRNQWVGPFRIAGRKGMLFQLEDHKGAKQRGLFHPIRLKKVNEERLFFPHTQSHNTQTS